MPLTTGVALWVWDMGATQNAEGALGHVAEEIPSEVRGKQRMHIHPQQEMDWACGVPFRFLWFLHRRFLLVASYTHAHATRVVLLSADTSTVLVLTTKQF